MAGKISKEALTSIESFAKQGKGVVEISSLLGLSQPTVSKYMKKLGFKTDMSAEGKKEEIVRLYEEGKLIKDIARLTNVSRNTVRKYLQKCGLTKKAEELRFGKETEKAMCEMYHSIQNIEEVAKYFGASGQGVRKVLLRNGVELRKVNERSLNTEPFRNLNTAIPVEVEILLNKVPKRINPKYQKATQLFEEIDTEEKAYWLGFIYADGGVYVGKNPKLYFGVKESDKDILVKFCKFTGISEDSIKTVTRKVKGRTYTSLCLDVPSVTLCQALLRKGVMPNKSLIQSPPSNEVLREDLIFHFIRGYFDGDGGINSDGSISVTGTLDMIEWIVEKFGDSTDRKLSQKDPNKNTFTYRIGGKKAKEILDKLYLNCSVSLDRKLKAYKSLCGFSQ